MEHMTVIPQGTSLFPSGDIHSRLLTLARRYVWWKAPEEAVRDRRHLLAQVMNLGTLEDCVWLEEVLGRHALADVLRHPPIGVFSGKTWHYWHFRLGLADAEQGVPPIPKRTYPKGRP